MRRCFSPFHSNYLFCSPINSLSTFLKLEHESCLLSEAVQVTHREQNAPLGSLIVIIQQLVRDEYEKKRDVCQDLIHSKYITTI